MASLKTRTIFLGVIKTSVYKSGKVLYNSDIEKEGRYKLERIILHVDVNNAFLSWTAVDRLKKGDKLDIRTIPAIIGGDEKQRKGVVLAKSPIAKKLGIQTGEPIYFARKKCPNLQIFQSDFKIYYQYSNALYEMLSEYTDKIERFSIDECFMEMTLYLGKRTPYEIAVEINKRVKEKFGFTVNVGIANNKLLAKMASDFEKPDKIHTLYKNEIETKMWTLPVSELFMVGKKSLPKLEKMKIKTIGDLAKKDEQVLVKSFGKYGKMIWEYANGIDNSEVVYEEPDPKCIGNSLTLPYDLSDIEKLQEVLLSITEQTTYRLRKHGMYASVVNVQLKTNDFKMSSHQKKLETATNSTKIIYEEAKKLLKELYKGVPIRLIGIRVDGLSRKDEVQLSIFDTKTNEKQERLDLVIDKIKDKYGYNSITRAGKIDLEEIPSKLK